MHKLTNFAMLMLFGLAYSRHGAAKALTKLFGELSTVLTSPQWAHFLHDDAGPMQDIVLHNFKFSTAAAAVK